MRFWAEFEVEVLDVTTARAFNNDWTRDDSGEPVMMYDEDDERVVAQAVSQVLTQGLHRGGESAGFKWLGGSSHPRAIEGADFAAVEIPTMPVRLEDGTYPPGWLDD